MLQLILIAIVGLCLGNVAAQELRRVDDTELIQLLTGESNVVVLFSKYINIYILIDEVQPTWAYVCLYACICTGYWPPIYG